MALLFYFSSIFPVQLCQRIGLF